MKENDHDNHVSNHDKDAKEESKNLFVKETLGNCKGMEKQSHSAEHSLHDAIIKERRGIVVELREGSNANAGGNGLDDLHERREEKKRKSPFLNPRLRVSARKVKTQNYTHLKELQSKCRIVPFPATRTDLKETS